MARNKKKQLPLLENVTIAACAAEGKALARVDDKVVFVPFVVPGDVVDLQVKKKKSSYMEAVAVKFHEFSPLRTDPRCRHYGVCGGCKWQCLQYEEQLKAKQQQVFDNLTRIGKVELPDFQPILGSWQVYGYRNKLEFGFSNKRWLTEEEVRQDVKYDVMDAVGFHITGAFDKILDITECHLMDDINNQIRNDIREYALQHGLEFYDLRQNRGLLRSLMIRTSNTGELMFLVQFRIDTPEEQEQADALMQHLSETFPQITSLLYVDNHKANDTFGDQEIHVVKGKDHIFEQMEDEYFAARAVDLRDVGKRIAKYILGVKEPEIGEGKVILCGQEIEPSVIAGLPTDKIAGVILGAGTAREEGACLMKEFLRQRRERDFFLKRRSGKHSICHTPNALAGEIPSPPCRLRAGGFRGHGPQKTKTKRKRRERRN